MGIRHWSATQRACVGGSALLIMAALYRLVLLTTISTHLDADQAITGIMAYRIEAGDRPAFYYGQPYQGSGEAYIAALFFKLFGPSALTARLPALVCSVAFVGVVYWLSTILYGTRTALLASNFIALGPPILLISTISCGFGYSEVMLCGTLLFLLAIRYPDPRTMPTSAALICGGLAGIGLWTQPLMLEYMLPIVIALSLRILAGWGIWSWGDWRAGGRALVIATLGFAAGGAPLFVYNLRYHWATIAYLHQRTQGGNPPLAAIRLITEALPVLLGPVIPTSVPQLFAGLVADHPLRYLTGLVGGAIIVVMLSFGRRGLARRIVDLSAPYRPRRDQGNSGMAGATWGDGILALFIPCCLLFFLCTGFGAARASTLVPRYLVPLYTGVPLILDRFMGNPARPADYARATLVTILLVILSLIAMADAGTRHASATSVAGTTLDPPSIAHLTLLLEARHVRVAYASYWLANRIAFETEEHILGVPVVARFRLGMVRVRGYLAVAARVPARNIAWIFDAGSRDDRDFGMWLQRTETRATRARWKDLAVYTGFSRPLRAPLTAQGIMRQ